MPRLTVTQAGVPEADARWLFQQILVAVDFCHRLGIALRDIKVRGLSATTRSKSSDSKLSACRLASNLADVSVSCQALTRACGRMQVLYCVCGTLVCACSRSDRARCQRVGCCVMW